MIAKIAGEFAAICALQKAQLHDTTAALFCKPDECHLLPKGVLVDLLCLMKQTDLKEVYRSCHRGQGGKGEHALLMDRLLDMPQLLLPTVAQVVVAAASKRAQGPPLTGTKFRAVLERICPDVFKVTGHLRDNKLCC